MWWEKSWEHLTKEFNHWGEEYFLISYFQTSSDTCIALLLHDHDLRFSIVEVNLFEFDNSLYLDRSLIVLLLSCYVSGQSTFKI
jgi:hypothetical protein